ncbi:sensor histidine kinase [Methylobacterium nodulans]|uniref:sensor histidine kinase n=1 Tax=Methylobacterium nodulans TaxID=114616 RepID=UPI0009FFC35E
MAGIVDVLRQDRAAALQCAACIREEERVRLSRELHDQAGQGIAVLKLTLTRLKQRLPPEAAGSLDSAIDLADQLARDLHRVAAGLRPAVLDHVRLVPALRALISDWEVASACRVAFTVTTCDVPLAPAVETALYRVVQEALTNITKHALTVDQVSVTVRCTTRCIAVMIEDNGAGFTSAAVKKGANRGQSDAHGLTGMNERIADLQGRLEIETRPDGGTRVVARVPLKGHLT